jgi:outer membrane protein
MRVRCLFGVWFAVQASAASSGLAEEGAPGAAAAAFAPEASPSFDLAASLIASDPSALTGDEAAAHARAYSPQIADARAVASSAHLDSALLRTGYLPVLAGFAAYNRYSKVESTFDIGRLLPDGADVPSFVIPPNTYQIGITGQYPVSDLFAKVWPRHRASERVAAAREHALSSTVADVDLMARQAFYEYARARATLLVAEQALKQAEAQAEQAARFVEAGTAPSVQLSKADARTAWMRAQVARAAAGVAITRQGVATLMGVSATEVAGIRENVAALPPAPGAQLEQLIKHGVHHRPEVLALRALLDATTLQKRAEAGGLMPSLALAGNVLHANPNPRYVPIVTDFKTTWQVGASVSWSPNEALVSHIRKRKSDADRQKLLADLQATEDAVHMEVVKAWEEYTAAVAGAHAAEEEARAAEHAYRVSLARYREESGVQLDVLSSDLALTESRLHYVNAVIDARLSLARLAHAAGTAP